jgi:hypothetical protein
MQDRDLICSELHEALELLTPPHRSDKLTKKARALRGRARRQCRRWLTDSNIIGLGVGPRLANGQETGELALRVHVRTKKARSRLGDKRIPPALRLPGLTRPVLVDVIESEIPAAELALAGDGLKLRGSTKSGTIGCVMRRENSPDLFAVTCFHVLNGKKQDVVEWTEFPPDPDPPNPALGQLAFMSHLLAGGNFPNKSDIALVRLGPGAMDPTVRGLGTITGIRTSPLIPGERVRLCGLGTSELSTTSSGVCQGEVRAVGVLRLVDYGPLGVFGFRNLVSCTHFTRKRDSGAAVLDDDNRLVGIHMAGTSAQAGNAESLFQPISAVITEFSVSLPLVALTPPVAPLKAAAVTEARPAPPVGNSAEAIDVLARTLWGEARGESAAGRRAVANVAVNRALHLPAKRFGGTIEAVCRRKFQFSCWNINDPNRLKLLAVTDGDAMFRECLEIARAAVKGELPDNTEGSDHYHAKGITPDWAEGRDPVTRIGKHLFYNNVP